MVLLELSTRERNRTLMQMTIFLRTLQAALKLDGEAVDQMLELYEAEVFHDLYVPEFQQELRAKERRRREEEARKAVEKVQALKKLDKFTEE